MAKLYFRYGAMGSSKTANAIMVRYNYGERGQKALILKPKLDTRDGEKVVVSRSGLRAPCEYIEDIDSLPVDRYDCLIVDEAQFLTKAQVEALVKIVDEKNIPVIAYGLRADFQGNLFEGSTWLCARADTIEEIKTVCWCGRKATQNARISGGRVVKAGEQILLGGNESYVALCRKHWATGEMGPAARVIVKETGERRRHMSLLLIADEEVQAIEKYIDEGDMYILNQNGATLCEAIVTMREDGHYEIKSLATVPEARRRGCARDIVNFIRKAYAGTGRNLFVGTGEPNRAFYERLGFQYAYTDKNFFVDNYEKPIYDCGVHLIDMLYFSMPL